MRRNKTWVTLTAYFLGFAICVAGIVSASGGRLLHFTHHASHKLVTRALMEGSFYFPYHLGFGEVAPDWQYFNGAVFTNWGYGVPLLQLPFFFFANLFSEADPFVYVSERLIFHFYVFLCVVLLLGAFTRLYRERYQLVSPWSLALWSAGTILILLHLSLFWLISLSFQVYGETIAYLVLMQLYALGAYLNYYFTGKLRWVVLAGFAAALGMVIRSTGGVYLLVWAGIFFLHRRKTALPFILASLPPISFWMAANLARTGKLISSGGLLNHMPSMPQLLEHARFGDGCSHSLLKKAELGWHIFRALFFSGKDYRPVIDGCTFEVVSNGLQFPAFLGAATFFVLSAIFVYNFFVLRKRWELYLPFLGFFAVLVGIANEGVSILYRYASDFWPFVLMIGVFFLLHNRLTYKKWMVAAVLGCFPIVFVYRLYTELYPQQRSSLIMTNKPNPLFGSLEGVQKHWGDWNGKNFGSNIHCTDVRPNEWVIKLVGWEPDCTVWDVTNLLIGVPKKEGSLYRIDFSTKAQVTGAVPIYVNGQILEGRTANKGYSAEFFLDFEELITPNVMVTIRWPKELKGIELERVRLY